MNDNVYNDLTTAADIFHAVVAPRVLLMLRRRVPGGSIVRLERDNATPFEASLDTNCGIDALLCQPGHPDRGLAIRVQYTDRPFGTFTIRSARATGAKTELEKRTLSLIDRSSGYLYPWLTIQAYVSADKQRLLSLGIVETEKLFGFVQQNRARLLGEQKTVWADDNRFLAIRWEELDANGAPVGRWDATPEKESA